MAEIAKAGPGAVAAGAEAAEKAGDEAGAPAAEAAAASPPEAEVKFPGKASKVVHVVRCPEKANWSLIRKMFRGNTHIKTGKMMMAERYAWLETDTEEWARTLATGCGDCDFVDDKWVVGFEQPAPKEVPEHKRNKPAGAYGGPAQKSYGRFPDEPAFRTGSTRDDRDYDYQRRPGQEKGDSTSLQLGCS